ncbi:MAG: glycoside hydrolase family 5 protein [Lachnospiraceae bacterium]|nr:glycoside hydrolase family 5 protein [Lachnospiraceae bacterium]
MKKRILTILLVALILSCTGCQNTAPDKPGTEEPTGAVPTETREDTAAPTQSGLPETETYPTESAEEPAFPLSDGITIPELEVIHYTTPDTEAMRFADALGVGWNLGNTFDAYDDDGYAANEMAIEEYWQHTYTTREMIADIKAFGFDSIRIPVSWHNHVSGDVEISEQWLSRVDEVIGWALDEGLYVIVNIHHDNHPQAGGIYPDSAHLEASKHYIQRIWEQLSERFEKYDEHLIFEAMNEPRLVGHNNEWWIDPGSEDCKDAIRCINELNQTFVDTVRATGGRNANRYLICTGYCASFDGVTSPFFRLPEDSTPDHLILMMHAYTPYSFALDWPGTEHFSVTEEDSTSEIDELMYRLYMKYIGQGIPVVIDEFGARDKNGNLQERVDFAAYFVNAARSRGISCFWWDNNAFSGDGELFGIYDRRDPANSTYDIISALMYYSK